MVVWVTDCTLTGLLGQCGLMCPSVLTIQAVRIGSFGGPAAAWDDGGHAAPTLPGTASSPISNANARRIRICRSPLLPGLRRVRRLDALLRRDTLRCVSTRGQRWKLSSCASILPFILGW